MTLSAVQYPWLCSLKYNRNHICGLTLLSGPPHHTVIVGAAHCFSPGDAVRSYTVTCGEHSLRSRGEYEVRHFRCPSQHRPT